MLRWPARMPERARRELEQAALRVSPMWKGPLRIALMEAPAAWRTELISGGSKGTEVHAASYLRKRRIVLAAELLEDSKELRRIFLHELFHFAWIRLANSDRHSWEEVVRREWRKNARGELGWSSESRKNKLRGKRLRKRRWREYLCESFCDTGAWACGRLGEHDEFTLGEAWRKERMRWWRSLLAGRLLSI